jgi:AhpD family alkylhydroperoxidase
MKLMKLDERITRLIAVGASVSANCQPCLHISVARALESGADQQEIAEAIEIGKMVRRGAASKLDTFAASLTDGALARATAGGCGCGS